MYVRRIRRKEKEGRRRNCHTLKTLPLEQKTRFIILSISKTEDRSLFSRLLPPGGHILVFSHVVCFRAGVVWFSSRSLPQRHICCCDWFVKVAASVFPPLFSSRVLIPKTFLVLILLLEYP